MGVPFAKIEELIEICKAVNEKDYDEEYDKRIHVMDIAATLQKLIDDEMTYLEETAKEFFDIEFFNQTDDDVSKQYEAVRGQLGRTTKDDWPHGV